MESKKFTEALTHFFDEQGISQTDIANRLKVSKAYINALFTGKQNFGKKQAEKWEKEFGLSKSWLITKEGDMLCPNINQENVSGTNVVGENTVNNNLSSELIDIIKKKDEQIDRLISIIENLNK